MTHEILSHDDNGQVAGMQRDLDAPFDQLDAKLVYSSGYSSSIDEDWDKPIDQLYAEIHAPSNLNARIDKDLDTPAEVLFAQAAGHMPIPNYTDNAKNGDVNGATPKPEPVAQSHELSQAEKNAIIRQQNEVTRAKITAREAELGRELTAVESNAIIRQQNEVTRAKITAREAEPGGDLAAEEKYATRRQQNGHKPGIDPAAYVQDMIAAHDVRGNGNGRQRIPRMTPEQVGEAEAVLSRLTEPAVFKDEDGELPALKDKETGHIVPEADKEYLQTLLERDKAHYEAEEKFRQARLAERAQKDAATEAERNARLAAIAERDARIEAAAHEHGVNLDKVPEIIAREAARRAAEAGKNDTDGQAGAPANHGASSGIHGPSQIDHELIDNASDETILTNLIRAKESRLADLRRRKNQTGAPDDGSEAELVARIESDRRALEAMRQGNGSARQEASADNGVAEVDALIAELGEIINKGSKAVKSSKLAGPAKQVDPQEANASSSVKNPDWRPDSTGPIKKVRIESAERTKAARKADRRNAPQSKRSKASAPDNESQEHVAIDSEWLESKLDELDAVARERLKTEKRKVVNPWLDQEMKKLFDEAVERAKTQPNISEPSNNPDNDAGNGDVDPAQSQQAWRPETKRQRQERLESEAAAEAEAEAREKGGLKAVWERAKQAYAESGVSNVVWRSYNRLAKSRIREIAGKAIGATVDYHFDHDMTGNRSGMSWKKVALTTGVLVVGAYFAKNGIQMPGFGGVGRDAMQNGLLPNGGGSGSAAGHAPDAMPVPPADAHVPADDIIGGHRTEVNSSSVWKQIEEVNGTNGPDTADILHRTRELNPGVDLDNVKPGQSFIMADKLPPADHLSDAAGQAPSGVPKPSAEQLNSFVELKHGATVDTAGEAVLQALRDHGVKTTHGQFNQLVDWAMQYDASVHAALGERTVTANDMPDGYHFYLMSWDDIMQHLENIEKAKNSAD